jgi:MFS transporter, SP family, arabinose:H+ symporter
VDRAGRKTLILAGTSLQFVSFALVGWFYHVHGSGLAVLIFVMSFVAGHAFGNGVACWVIISEIYPTKVRGRGMSIATTALWLVGYLGNQMFPMMQKHLGADGTFWLFSSGALLTVVLVGWLISETKGRSLEEIHEIVDRAEIARPGMISSRSVRSHKVFPRNLALARLMFATAD